MILAIDTSTAVGGVAVLDGDKLVASRTLNVVKTHSERLMGAVENLLGEAELDLKRDIHAIACGIGPGSFTGVRIAVSAAKCMAYALDIPLVGVSSLDALACAFLPNERIVPMIDARHDRVYCAIYEGSFENKGYVKRVSDYELLNVHELLKKAYSDRDTVWFTGDGAYCYKELINSYLEGVKKAKYVPRELALVDPVKIAMLANLKLNNSELSDVSGLVPMYLKESEPIEKLNEGGSR